MKQEYEFRVTRWGVLLPEVRITVKAESLDEATEKAKSHLRGMAGERIYRGGWRTAKRTFTVDGSKLTSARIEMGLSMEDVVGEIGGKKSNLSRWERGLAQPSDRSILELVVLFNRCDFVKER